jgi:hypothetical protein
MDRKTLERTLWRYTHKDYRGSMSGTKTVLHNDHRGGGTVLCPISNLTDEQIVAKLPAKVAAILAEPGTARETAGKLAFYDWQKKASHWASELVGIGEIWSTDDPYDLTEAAAAAFTAEQTPRAFIEEMFADDIASAAHDHQQTTEALAGEFDE